MPGYTDVLATVWWATNSKGLLPWPRMRLLWVLLPQGSSNFDTTTPKHWLRDTAQANLKKTAVHSIFVAFHTCESKLREQLKHSHRNETTFEHVFAWNCAAKMCSRNRLEEELGNYHLAETNEAFCLKPQVNRSQEWTTKNGSENRIRNRLLAEFQLKIKCNWKLYVA